ncbi:MAG: NosD domain-containing protein, partial [Flavobacteriaceae bacterium]|nr:NosD domain-containing protein [Flavobacteriaceae bacterium]
MGTVIWHYRVRVNGVVRIPATSRLIIMPGTVVEFTKNDTNEDGIGENGLLVMGMLVAKGTKEKPIIFRSAEKDRQAGDWDAINIYTSDGFQNILEHVQVEDAYRALHIHFSNVYVGNSVFRGNYRGMQFQESLVEVKGTEIYGNKSAIRARDSELRFVGNRVFDNYFGPNLYRITGEVSSNLFSGNLSDGLRVREGGLDVKENTILTNRYGLTVAYANFGSFHDNIISYNQEIGIALKGTDNIKVSRNFVQLNGVNGMSILTASAEIQGNHFADNGERGIGVISFKGLIEGNNFVNNGLYAIGLDGVSDISAPNNWWGSGVDMEKIIFDRKDKAGLGLVDYEIALEKPIAFTWPVPQILVDTVWDGEFILPQRVDTQMGSFLSVKPGSVIKFGKDVSLWLFGKFEAVGLPDKRILFTAEKETEDQLYWDQITTEKNSAVFKFCDFQNGNMALHSHFSNVEVNNCRFRRIDSGFRARGG